jgi:hypothetical protein
MTRTRRAMRASDRRPAREAPARLQHTAWPF